ncbi:dTDP-glucose 4,6-dehydratase [bacterium]|nr:dTDP-glucose 4,6-dehydratase [bacterium]|tara:strand:+ start:39855 stop:40859 length:1005 start_codon:yes stop_codon:yes gene_type:complete
MHKNVLITGGCGFIGSAFLRKFVPKYKNTNFINLDLLTYAGNKKNVEKIKKFNNYRFIHGDIRDKKKLKKIFKNIDSVIHFAAESHVDRSIDNSDEFIKTNILGTHCLLEESKRNNVAKFIAISTDEVYGSLSESDKASTENDKLQPRSPYSASKASSDLLCLSYHETFGMHVCITRCSNNYGPYQYPEKLIPVLIKKILNNEKVPIYGDGKNIRDWIHVDDHVEAIEKIWQNGSAGEIYNIGGDSPKRNLEIAKKVLYLLEKDEKNIQFVKDRPGHDWRYEVNDKKIKTNLGWKPKIDFLQGIEDTVKWYIENQDWWKPLLKEAGGRRGLKNE